MLKRSMIHGSYVYSYPETLAASGFQENLKNFEQHLSINAGVAEQNMTGLATGLALEGRIVFTYSIANFSTFRCLEQIRNDACYHEANVKVVSIGGGFSYGALGISHHATEDISVMRSLPDITVVSPCDCWEAEEATEALVSTPGTCFLRIDKSAGIPCRRPGERFELGKARMVREGWDLTIAVTGGILEEAQKAANRLSDEGIELRLLSVHTIKPFDSEAIINAALETGGIITVEEHSLHGGLGGLVSETLMDAGIMPQRFMRLGLEDTFSSIVGSQQYLRKRYGLDSTAIENKIRSMLQKTAALRT